ncbi:transposase family protein [Vibrio cholerae]|nr:transposase family protein [Vibrio cholerae]
MDQRLSSNRSGRAHLSEINLLKICGILSGYDNWEGINDFGITILDFLKAICEFGNCISSSDMIVR